MVQGHAGTRSEHGKVTESQGRRGCQGHGPKGQSTEYGHGMPWSLRVKATEDGTSYYGDFIHIHNTESFCDAFLSFHIIPNQVIS